MNSPTSQPRAAGQAAQLFATLDTHAGLFLTRLNPDGLTKRIVARFDRDSTAEEQTEVLRACNSHAALVAALDNTSKALLSAMDRLESARMQAHAATYATVYHDARAILNAEIAKRDSRSPFTP